MPSVATAWWSWSLSNACWFWYRQSRNYRALYILSSPCFTWFNECGDHEVIVLPSVCNVPVFGRKTNCCLSPLWLIDQLTKSWIGLDLTQVASQRILSVGPAEEGMGLPYELLNGRAGFLYAALFLNHHIGPDVVPWSITVSQVLTMSYKSHTWWWPTQNDDQRIIDIYLFLFLANGSLTSDDDLFHLVTVNWASSDLGVTNTS